MFRLRVSGFRVSGLGFGRFGVGGGLGFSVWALGRSLRGATHGVVGYLG